MIVSIMCQKFYFTVNGSEDIDVLPNGLAIFSSVSNQGCKWGGGGCIPHVSWAIMPNVIPTTTSSKTCTNVNPLSGSTLPLTSKIITDMHGEIIK